MPLQHFINLSKNLVYSNEWIAAFGFEPMCDLCVVLGMVETDEKKASILMTAFEMVFLDPQLRETCRCLMPVEQFH